MKLELKHIAPYLPYDLRVEVLDYKSDYVGRKHDDVIGVHQWSGCGELWSCLTKGGGKPAIDRVKPILRPLSELNKEIEHKGKRFIPIDTLIEFIVPIRFKEDYVRSNYKTCYDSVKGDLNSFVYAGNKEYGVLSLTENLFIMSKLFEWHFDVFRLIEDDLAIDISTR